MLMIFEMVGEQKSCLCVLWGEVAQSSKQKRSCPWKKSTAFQLFMRGKCFMSSF